MCLNITLVKVEVTQNGAWVKSLKYPVLIYNEVSRYK